MAELAQAGIFRAVEKHISRGNLPVVADFIFCEDFRSRSFITGNENKKNNAPQYVLTKGIH